MAKSHLCTVCGAANRKMSTYFDDNDDAIVEFSDCSHS